MIRQIIFPGFDSRRPLFYLHSIDSFSGNSRFLKMARRK